MPLRRGGKKTPQACNYCGTRASRHHHFEIDLHDGKPLITVHACSEYHANELKRALADFLPKDA